MATRFPNERLKKAEVDTAGPALYHEPLRDNLPAWSGSASLSKLSGREFPASDIKKDLARTTTFALPSSILGIAQASRLDLTRFFGDEHLEEMTDFGEKVIDRTASGDEIHKKRGRLEDPQSGIRFTNGSALRLNHELLEESASRHFTLEGRFAARAELILPQSAASGLKRTSADSPEEWKELKETSRARHYQAAYEMALALAVLKRAVPSSYESIMNSSRLLQSITVTGGEPGIIRFSSEFQRRFCADQKDVAWAWRNLLEPGKPHVAAVIPDRDVPFRNQMGLGMLEYLSIAGQDAIDYMRAFGNAMADKMIDRSKTETRDLEIILPGVPLEGGKFVRGAPELFLFLAREHHELWRFSREISWLLPDESFHQPERKEHKPWRDLTANTRNRDLLNIYGVCYMLAKMDESDFNTIRNAAVRGNPHGFELSPVEMW